MDDLPQSEPPLNVVSLEDKVGIFIAWTYPSERPTTIEYELTSLEGNVTRQKAPPDQAIEVITPSKIRWRCWWDSEVGCWSDRGLSWVKPS
jgi:hypothetical protein